MGHTVRECRTKKQAESSDAQQQGSSQVVCYVCNRKGHKSGDCKKLDEFRDAVFTGAGMDRNNVKCFFCDQIGHIVRDCPKKWRKNEKVGCGQGGEDDASDSECGAAAHVIAVEDEDTSDEEYEKCGTCWTTSEVKMPVCQGKVGKYKVQTLRDTGTSCVVVKRKFVGDRQLTGKTRSIVQMLGTRVRLPVAKIYVDTPYWKGEVEALCAEEMLYDLIIGNVRGARDPDDPDMEWEEREAVETLDEKKEDLDVKSLKTAECQDTEATAVNYLELQEEDVSLNRLRRMTGIRRKRNSMSWFQTEKGILYRVFQSPKVNKGKPVKQIVLPRVLRAHVTALAHESDRGGHLGAKKTKDKVLLDFYWPGIGEDVEQYCRSCVKCQRRRERAMAGQKEKRVHHHDKTEKTKQLEVGDAVLVLTNTRDEQGVMQWKGPNRVMGVVRPNQYQVKVNEKIRTYHISRLKKYIHESEKHMSKRWNC